MERSSANGAPLSHPLQRFLIPISVSHGQTLMIRTGLHFSRLSSGKGMSLHTRELKACHLVTEWYAKDLIKTLAAEFIICALLQTKCMLPHSISFLTQRLLV